MKRKKNIALVLLIAMLISLSMVVIHGTAAENSNMPVSPEPPEKIDELQQWIYYQGYNYTVAENWITALPPEERSRLCGYKPPMAPTRPLPPNVDFRVDGSTESEMILQSSVGALPSAYDARDYGYVTPVKDQEDCGSCWIFAATADFESEVAIGESNLRDFSEQELGDCNIREWFCGGGNAYVTTNYFSKKGAANETCHTYAATEQTCQGCLLLKNVDNWRIITGIDGDELSNVDTIKNAILEYGPVYTTMYVRDDFFYYSGGVYEYLHPPNQPNNHAILIIGWNDTLGDNGAWLIKNSWGTGWGMGGYAWVAYGSAKLGESTSAISGYNNADDQIHYYDEYGWLGAVAGCPPATTAYGAVRFNTSQCGQLHSVDFWAIDPDMQYEIRIFDAISGGPSGYTFSNQRGSTQTGITKEEGYYSIPLDTPIWLDSEDDFVVQVKFTTTTGYNYPIPIDYEASSVVSGESYSSCDGTSFEKSIDYDIGIRARQNVEECGQCLGDCYAGSDCTGDLIATNVPCYQCLSEYGRYWKPNRDDACFNDVEPFDLCLNYCPQCCNGFDDDDQDAAIDYPDDDDCTCGLDPSEVEELPPVPELPTILLFSVGLLVLAGYAMVRRKHNK
jgi:C1A family cysteine protease